MSSSLKIAEEVALRLDTLRAQLVLAAQGRLDPSWAALVGEVDRIAPGVKAIVATARIQEQRLATARNLIERVTTAGARLAELAGAAPPVDGAGRYGRAGMPDAPAAPPGAEQSRHQGPCDNPHCPGCWLVWIAEASRRG